MSTIPKTMYCWRKHRGNPEPVWESIPVPPCPRTGYLVRTLASGVCHSDEAILKIDYVRPNIQERYTLGHEGCGEVVEVGADVGDGTQGEDIPGVVHRLGDRVALLCVPGCGEAAACEDCRRGLPQLCNRANQYGMGGDGFYAPYVAVDRRAAVALPDGIAPEVAAVATDAVLTSYHGIVRRAEVKKDETVFMFGLGGLGFNALQIVHNDIGARVIVSDVRDEVLEEAVKLGVPRSDVVPVGTPIQDWVRENGLSNQIDTVLDFVGKQQTISDAQQIVRQGGKILCVGILDAETKVHMQLGVRKRLSYLFTYGGQYRDLVACLDLIQRGIVTPRVETRRLKDFPEVLRDLSAGKIKARMALTHERTEEEQPKQQQEGSRL